MTNAVIQALLTLGTTLLGWGLAWSVGLSQPALFSILVALPFLITPAVLALQFVLLWFINANDPTPRASLWQHVRAWCGECQAAFWVFQWWQPFRRTVVADDTTPTPGRRGMVLVHGFLCNRAFWTRWMQRLQQEKRVFVAVDLEPAFGSIDDYVPIVERAVEQVTAATGLPPVVVCHSMGGLVLRKWLGHTDNAARIHRIFTIGTPHQGTALARWSPAMNGSQMHISSAWMRALSQSDDSQHRGLFVCFYSNCDNIVFPVSCAMLPWTDNRLVVGRGHVDLAFSPIVQTACRDALHE